LKNPRIQVEVGGEWEGRMGEKVMKREERIKKRQKKVK